MDDLNHLLEKLDEIIERIHLHVNDPNERPTWLHWSDVAILRDSCVALAQQNEQIARARQALGVALTVRAPVNPYAAQEALSSQISAETLALIDEADEAAQDDTAP